MLQLIKIRTSTLFDQVLFVLTYDLFCLLTKVSKSVIDSLLMIQAYSTKYAYMNIWEFA